MGASSCSKGNVCGRDELDVTYELAAACARKAGCLVPGPAAPVPAPSEDDVMVMPPGFGDSVVLDTRGGTPMRRAPTLGEDMMHEPGALLGAPAAATYRPPRFHAFCSPSSNEVCLNVASADVESRSSTASADDKGVHASNSGVDVQVGTGINALPAGFNGRRWNACHQAPPRQRIPPSFFAASAATTGVDEPPTTPAETHVPPCETAARAGPCTEPEANAHCIPEAATTPVEDMSTSQCRLSDHAPLQSLPESALESDVAVDILSCDNTQTTCFLLQDWQARVEKVKGDESPRQTQEEDTDGCAHVSRGSTPKADVMYGIPLYHISAIDVESNQPDEETSDLQLVATAGQLPRASSSKLRDRAETIGPTIPAHATRNGNETPTRSKSASSKQHSSRRNSAPDSPPQNRGSRRCRGRGIGGRGIGATRADELLRW